MQWGIAPPSVPDHLTELWTGVLDNVVCRCVGQRTSRDWGRQTYHGDMIPTSGIDTDIINIAFSQRHIPLIGYLNASCMDVTMLERTIAGSKSSLVLEGLCGCF